MFKNKTIDSVVQSVNKMIDDLVELQVKHTEESNNQAQVEIDAARKKIEETDEANRAGRIVQKLEELIQ